MVYRPGNSFVETSDIFFKPVNKKRPPRRNQKKFPYRKHVSRPSILNPNHNSVAPETTFHFVDDIDARPPRNKVKRFPAATSNNLDVNRPGQGIVSLLKKEDLTVMAALLEETDLYRSIDKQGKSQIKYKYSLVFEILLKYYSFDPKSLSQTANSYIRVVRTFNFLLRMFLASSETSERS